MQLVKNKTFQSIVCHDWFWRSCPCAPIMEKRVCPALFLTAGLWSTQSCPSLRYNDIQRLSKEGSAVWECCACCCCCEAAVDELFSPEEEACAVDFSFCSLDSRSSFIFNRDCEKWSAMFHWNVIKNQCH